MELYGFVIYVNDVTWLVYFINFEICEGESDDLHYKNYVNER
jgi:hypothetical protein